MKSLAKQQRRERLFSIVLLVVEAVVAVGVILHVSGWAEGVVRIIMESH